MAGEGSGSPKQPVPVTEGPVAQIRSGTRLQPEAPDRLLTAPTPASGWEFNAETHRALGHNVVSNNELARDNKDYERVFPWTDRVVKSF